MSGPLLPKFIAPPRPGGELRRWHQSIALARLMVILLAASSGTALLAEDVSVRATSSDAKSAVEVFAGEFVEIAPGQPGFPKVFRMGAEHPAGHEQSARQMALSATFKMSKYEVWQQLYQEVMGENPSRWRGDRNSAEQMTWKEAREFCRRVTIQMRQRGLISPQDMIRLPTEAEWEYCCRAGTTTRYSFGDDPQNPGDQFPQAGRLDRYAWHAGNAAGNDPAVGVLAPNPWGLYDMHGYLWEFCEDRWTGKADEQPSDSDSGENVVPARCVIRGGSWRTDYHRLTCSSRAPFAHTGRSDAVGFRCVLVREQPHAP